MPKGYWIVQANVQDMDAYKAYIEANRETMMAHGARYLVRGGRCETVEGTGGASRNAIIEFESYDTALACWQSVGYQEARQKRVNAADMRITVVEGLEA